MGLQDPRLASSVVGMWDSGTAGRGRQTLSRRLCSVFWRSPLHYDVSNNENTRAASATAARSGSDERRARGCGALPWRAAAQRHLRAIRRWRDSGAGAQLVSGRGGAIRTAPSANAGLCVLQLCAQEPDCEAANWCPLQARPLGGRAAGRGNGGGAAPAVRLAPCKKAAAAACSHSHSTCPPALTFALMAAIDADWCSACKMAIFLPNCPAGWLRRRARAAALSGLPPTCRRQLHAGA